MQLISYIIRQVIFRFLLILFGCFWLQPVHAQCLIAELLQDLDDPNVSKGFKDFIDGNNEGLMAYNMHLDSRHLRKDVDVLNATANFLTRNADYLEKFPGKFDAIINNLKRAGVRCNTCPTAVNQGIPSMNVIIDNLDWLWTNFKKGNANVQKLLTEMVASPQKADGGAYMINVLWTNAQQEAGYVKSIKSFEYRYLDNGDFEADLVRVVGGKTVLSEYKSWSKTSWDMFGINGTSQLKGYLRSGDFFYIANVTKLNKEVDKPLQYVKEQFLKAFINDESIFKANPLFFEENTYGAVKSFEQLQTFCKADNAVNSSLFNFITVK